MFLFLVVRKRETCLCFPFAFPASFINELFFLWGRYYDKFLYRPGIYPKRGIFISNCFLNFIKTEKLTMPLIITPEGTICDSPLTPRERNVLELMAKGLKQKQIALRLSITMDTTRTHIKNAYRKLGAHNKVDALRKSGIW